MILTDSFINKSECFFFISALFVVDFNSTSYFNTLSDPVNVFLDLPEPIFCFGVLPHGKLVLPFLINHVLLCFSLIHNYSLQKILWKPRRKKLAINFKVLFVRCRKLSIFPLFHTWKFIFFGCCCWSHCCFIIRIKGCYFFSQFFFIYFLF